MKSISTECYYAASYARLSKEDGDKAESDSINNQKELIRNYQKSHPEINIVKEYFDDGYSGVDFERPDFKQMLADIKEKKINCIIVKDLSRFGRNYIETGKYIEQLFPFLGVRFIAINDGYDSASVNQQGEQMLLPFKNLINDIYCRDISIKVRSNLNAKRKKGDYVGSFAPYGYKKSDHNKNQLMIDEPAAKTVRRIFLMKLAGKSNAGIADILNSESLPAPYEYKKNSVQGRNFIPSFYINSNPKWSVTSISRILQNEVYLGNLVQGKSIRPNYKVKKQVLADDSEWIRVENTHEPIVTGEEFHLVQKMLMLDTRISPGQENLYLLSGLLFCANCGEPLIRRKVSSGKENYIYYGCYTKGKKVKCKGIVIRESAVKKAVLESIKIQVKLIIDRNALLAHVDQIPIMKSEVKSLDNQIQTLETKESRYKKIRSSLYEDYREGLFNQEEYIELKNIYDKEEKKIKPVLIELAAKRKDILAGKSDNQKCINLFKRYQNFEELDRRTILMLISKISICSKKSVKVRFAYQNEFSNTL